jgi:undecaprenyl-diphosphatase
VSGHSAIIIAVGITYLYLFKPKLRKYIWLVAALVGVSRIYLGLHLPLDVIGGWALGAFVAVTIQMLMTAQKQARNKRKQNPVVVK